ncbi:MAG: FlgD immunoglobulin-like domain containing protein, partial [Endozoicomonas sp.]
VYDSSGSMVESSSLGPQQAGAVPFSLDTLASGNYTITATAVSGDQAFAAGVGLKARVTGVEAGAGGASLQLDGIGSFPLSSVSMIGE